MTPEERKYAKQVDEQILHASGDELQYLQELDIQTQLKADNFYEALAQNPKTKEVPFGIQKSSGKNQS